MRDFSSNGAASGLDRRFTVNGHEFAFIEVIGSKALSDFSDWMRENNTPGNKFLPPRSFERLTDAIRECLTEESQEQWDGFLTSGARRTLTLEQLMEIFDHMFEANTGHPTQQASPSGTTGESGTPKSTDGSASPEGQGSPASISGRF